MRIRLPILLLAAASSLSACGSGGGGPLSGSSDISASALQAAVRDPDVRRFYQANGWQAVWNKDLTKQLTEAIHLAPKHALLPDMFMPKALPEDPAQRETALTKAALAYGQALAFGRTDPGKTTEVYTLPRPKVDLAKGLTQAATDKKIGEWLDGLAPQTDEYRALSKAFLHYAQLAASGPEQDIAAGKPIKPGATDARIVPLVEALKANGYLPVNASLSSSRPQYAPAIAQAVKAMQADFGLKPDGVVGPDTLQILNTGAVERARQIAVNMERRRWLSHDLPATRIDVNTAATFLEYWRDGQLKNRRNVVVGQPDWETPQLGSPMFQLVAHPTWTVPDSIAEEELAGKGAGYFASQNITMRNGKYVQMPGPKNALGEVKFDLKNDQAIYLHDTPARALFTANERHRSHGCVRVQDALGFARMIAQDDGILEQFDAAYRDKPDDVSYVPMKTQIPVRLLYHTVFLDADGQLSFRTDVYGWDNDVAVALGRPQATRHKLRRQSGDIGP
ncbi:MAG: murein L,D-transpeptidase [Sphingomicrobium sp.]